MSQKLKVRFAYCFVERWMNRVSCFTNVEDFPIRIIIVVVVVVIVLNNFLNVNVIRVESMFG